MGDEQQQQTGAQNDGATATGQAQTPANGGQGSTEARTFTQEELDKIISDRLAREREKLTGKYADYDALKAAKAKLDELEAAQLSEQDKLAKRLKELEDAKTAAEAEKDRALKDSSRALKRAAIVAEAGRQRARTPDDAWLLLGEDGLEMDESGAVKGVEAAVKALIDKGRLPTLDKPDAPNTDAGRGTAHKPEPGQQLAEEEQTLIGRLGIKPEDFKKYRNA